MKRLYTEKINLLLLFGERRVLIGDRNLQNSCPKGNGCYLNPDQKTKRKVFTLENH